MSIDSLAAKRALTSAGIVGGTSALLNKGLGLDLKLALGTALASSLLFDFYVNKAELTKNVEVAKTEIGRVIEREDAATGNIHTASIVTGCVAVLAGASFLLGSYRAVRPAIAIDGGGGGVPPVRLAPPPCRVPARW